MELFISKTISSIVQIAIFTLIPFIWWLATARKQEGFFPWIGLKRIDANDTRTIILWSAAAFVILAALGVGILWLIQGVETATSVFVGLGLPGLPAALVYAFLNTALPEELLFRGFLLKRLSAKLGFTAANIIQSALFGLIHGAMLFAAVDLPIALAAVVFTGAVGYIMGYVNERKADGSILPSWCIHGLSNVLSSCIALFG